MGDCQATVRPLASMMASWGFCCWMPRSELSSQAARPKAVSRPSMYNPIFFICVFELGAVGRSVATEAAPARGIGYYCTSVKATFLVLRLTVISTVPPGQFSICQEPLPADLVAGS